MIDVLRPLAGRRPGFLGPIALGLIGVAVAVAAVQSLPIAAGVILIGMWLAWLRVGWPHAAIVSLVACVAVPRFVYPINGVNVNAERLVLPAIAMIVAMVVVVNRRQFARLGYAHVGVAILITGFALGSWLNAPSRGDSLRLTLLVLIASLPFWILPQLITEARQVRFAVNAFIVVGVLEAVLGLIALGAYRFAGVNLGIQIDILTQSPAPYGTQWEGNIFGSFVASAAIAALAIGWKRSGSGRLRMLLAGAVMVLATVLSLSRGAWLGLIAGAIVVFLANFSPKRLAIGLWLIATVSLLTGPLVASAVQDRSASGSAAAAQRLLLLPQLVSGQIDATTQERFYNYQLALAEWSQHPVVGWGAGSLGEKFLTLSQTEPAWLSNLELHVLHDAGIVGLLGLLIAVAGILWPLARRLRTNPAEDGSIAGMLGACTCLLVAFQSTEATWLGYSWFVFGIAWCAVAVANAGERSGSAYRVEKLTPALPTNGS